MSPPDSSSFPAGMQSSGFQSHSGGFRSIPVDSLPIPVDSCGFWSHSGEIQWNPVIPAGILGASRSTVLRVPTVQTLHSALNLSKQMSIFPDIYSTRTHASPQSYRALPSNLLWTLAYPLCALLSDGSIAHD